jgi:hypothetical protein
MNGLTGSFAETGGDAQLLEYETENGLTGSYTATGNGTLLQNKLLAGDAGAVSLTGGAAVMTVIPATGGLNDGDPVATWPDNSGRGFNLTQPLASSRHSRRTFHGKPVIRFDGTGIISKQQQERLLE